MKTQELKKTLELVKPGLANKEILEQATSIIFKDGHAWTFNDEVAVMAPLEIGITGAVPAEPLYQFLAKLSPDVEVEIAEGENELKLKAGRNRAGIRMDPDIKLPLDEELVEPEEWNDIPEGFLPALQNVLFSASRSGHLPILTCVHIADEFMETCDEFRMTRQGGFTLKMEGDIKIVAKHLEQLKDYKPTEDGINGHWLHFRNEGGVVYAVRMVEGEYPDLSGFIINDGVEISFPKELNEALDWAAVMADDKIKYEQEVSVLLTKGNMTVRGEGPDGWAEQTLRLKYTGDNLTFKSHPLFLKEMAKLAKKVTVGDTALKVEGENGFVHVVALEE